MVEILIKLLSSRSSKIEEDTLILNYVVEDVGQAKVELAAFKAEELMDNDLDFDKIKVGEIVPLEIPISLLSRKGIYTSYTYFLNNYSYALPIEKIYLYNEKEYLQNTSFYDRYKAIIDLIDAFKSIAKYNYERVNEPIAFLGREGKYLLVPLTYSENLLHEVANDTLDVINQFLGVLSDQSALEKRDIFINELIEFLDEIDEVDRFTMFVKRINQYFSKANDAYSFYLSDFKYNKLKIEIDSKLLEFNQKIQGVINDSQNKLIAIPAAFILGLSSFDYDNVRAAKNYVLLIGLLIFSILIQIFINNQKSTMGFLRQNIDSYKRTFGQNLALQITVHFSTLDNEWIKQRRRLFYTNSVLWFTFVFAVVFYLYQLLNSLWVFVFCGAYLLSSLCLFICKYVLNGRIIS